MKSFAMLISVPLDEEIDDLRYFIDASRVSHEDYHKLVDNSDRQDSFQTYKFGDRWHFRSVCYR